MPKRMILIAPLFPPEETSRSIRMFFLVKNLIKNHWFIDVITMRSTKNLRTSSFSEIYNYIPDNIRIFETFPGLYIYFRNLLKSKNKLIQQETRNNVKINTENQTSFCKNFLRKLLDLLMPDRTMDWLPFAILRGKKLLKTNKYDVIFSTDPISHLAGLLIRNSKDIPLLLEYGDPWAYNPAYHKPNYIFKIEKFLETKVLKESCKIVVTTNETKNDYLFHYGSVVNKKISTVFSGYDPKYLSDTPNMVSDKFNVVYTGSIPGIRGDLLPLFQAIREIEISDNEFKHHFQLTLVGGVQRREKIDDSLHHFLKLTDRLPFKKSLEYMKGATVLLLLGNKGGLQIPAKVFWYIGAKKPILTILGDENDPIKPLMTKIKRGYVVNNNKEEIKKAIKKMYQLYKEGKLGEAFDLSDIEEFTWEKRFEKLNIILEEIIHKNNEG